MLNMHDINGIILESLRLMYRFTGIYHITKVDIFYVPQFHCLKHDKTCFILN